MKRLDDKEIIEREVYNLKNILFSVCVNMVKTTTLLYKSSVSQTGDPFNKPKQTL